MTIESFSVEIDGVKTGCNEVGDIVFVCKKPSKSLEEFSDARDAWRNGSVGHSAIKATHIRHLAPLSLHEVRVGFDKTRNDDVSLKARVNALDAPTRAFIHCSDCEHATIAHGDGTTRWARGI